MKNIKIVIGAMFGDEGKGLMTDYFCNQLSKNEERVLNVRFNGSSQAGHTVVTPNWDKRHIFSQLGAGSFNESVDTYLSSKFIVNPIEFNIELLDFLGEVYYKPKVTVCSDSTVIIPFDSLINIFKEESRGMNRHGSCGAGVFESVVRNGHPSELFHLTIKDCVMRSDGQLKWRLQNIRDNYYKDMIEELCLSEEKKDLFFNDNLIDNFIKDTRRMLNYVHVSSDEFMLNKYENIVFEGAQGLLLDWDFEKYSPHLTASHTGLKNVVELLKSTDIIKDSDIEVCYVMRSYTTRHGAGPFETEVYSKASLNGVFNEKTNQTNQFQGHFRYGYMDKPLVARAILDDFYKYAKDNSNYTIDIFMNPSVAITHLDETNNKILVSRQEGTEMGIMDFCSSFLEYKDIYISTGETRRNVVKL